MRVSAKDQAYARELLASLPAWITWGQRRGCAIDEAAFARAIDFVPSDSQRWPKRCRWCACRLTGRQSMWCAKHAQLLWPLRSWQGLSHVIALRDGGRCRRCGAEGRRSEVDHIIPVRAGGTDHPDNLRLVCKPCHGDIGIEQRKLHPLRWRDGRKYYATITP